TGLALALGVALCAPLLDVFFSITVDPAQLAVPQPDRLAVIGPSTAPGHATFISLEQYEQLRSLPGIASIGVSTFFNQVNVGAGRLPLLVYAQRVDRGYLATLAMPMALGRYFSAAEDAPHGPRAVIISHGFWLQHFGGSRAVIGKNLSINGQTTRIVGVLPKSFPKLLYTSVPLLLPLRAAPGLMRDTGSDGDRASRCPHQLAAARRESRAAHAPVFRATGQASCRKASLHRRTAAALHACTYRGNLWHCSAW
ncbi:permease, partial [mine drainage metagenome]